MGVPTSHEQESLHLTSTVHTGVIANFSFHGPYALLNPNHLLILRIDSRSLCKLIS